MREVDIELGGVPGGGVGALHRRLQELKADPNVSPARRVTAYEQWFRAAVRAGQEPDAAPKRPRPGGRNGRKMDLRDDSPERKTMTDTNIVPNEQELESLSVSLEATGWTLVGFVTSGKENVPGIYKAERLGTSVVTQASTTSKGLLAAVEAYERHEAASKDDLHDVRRGDDDAGGPDG